MKTSTIVTGTVVGLLMGALAGCGGGKGAARTEVQKAEAVCKAGKPDEAREMLFKAGEKNQTLQDALKFATAGSGDIPNINPCGPVMAELKKQLQ